MKSFVLVLVGLLPLSNSFTQWMQISSAPQNFIQNIVDLNGILYLSHSFEGIYKSTDGAVTWQQVNNGLNNNFSKTVYEVISYNQNLYAATADGIYKSTNDGNEWIKKSNGITVDPQVMYEYTVSVFEHNSTLFTGAYNGIYLSADGADTWIVTNVTGEHIKAKNFTAHNGILFAARETINQPNGYKSTDNGITWEGITGLPVPSISFYSEPGKLWAGTIHAVWLSTNNGNNWELRENGLPPDPYNSSVIRVNGVLMTSLPNGGPGVFTSTNEGIIWEGFGQGLPPTNNIIKLIIYNDKILAATSQGLWQRDISEVIPVELISFTASVSGTDVQLNWLTGSEINNSGFEVERKNPPLNPLRGGENSSWGKVGFVEGNGTTTETKAYSFKDNNLSAGKYSYRLKQIDYDGTFEYSDEVEAEVGFTPGEFVLYQNYPNPFNPSTVISFQLPVAGRVTLRIFNVIGEEVAALINNKEFASGLNNANFNAEGLNSGIYFYTLEAEGVDGSNFTSTKKMLIIK